MGRDPSLNPTPLDRAGFFIEELKYGPGPGKLEPATLAQVTNQMEILLREAGVQSMTGRELLDAAEFYVLDTARSYQISAVLARSVFLDGLMHGIALAGGVVGEHRDSKAER